MKVKNVLDELRDELSKNGNISKRSASKFIIDIMTNSSYDIETLTELIKMSSMVKKCKLCNKLDYTDICSLCKKNKDEGFETVSVFNSYLDIIELGDKTPDGMRSCFLIGDGNKNKKQSIDSLQLKELESFVSDNGAKEVILFFDKNVKNDIVAKYIRSFFANKNIKVSSLAVGISLGNSVEFLDSFTISQALKNRGDD